VQGDELVAHEVVAGRQVLGDGTLPLTAADDLGNVPTRGLLGVEEDLNAVAVEAGLVDLKPAGAVARARAEGALALVQPDQDRALAIRPLLPDGRDPAAGRYRGVHRGRRQYSFPPWRPSTSARHNTPGHRSGDSES